MRAPAAMVVAGALLGGCSLLVDTSDLATSSGAAPGGGAADADGSASARDGGSGSGGDDDDVDDGSVDPVPAAACPSAGRSCVADAPSGWTGPLVLYDGGDANVPKCPATMASSRVEAHRGFRAPATPHTCSSCSCAAGSGAECSASYFESCDLASTAVPLATSCRTTGSGSLAVRVESTGGTCPATGGVPQRPAVPWDARIRACGTDGLLRTGCADGQICAPDPVSPFRAKHCVEKTGDVACPGAPYTEKLVASQADDERSCSSCTCGPAGNNCTGFFHTFQSSNTCGGVPKAVSLPGPACTTLPDGTLSLKLVSLVSAAPKCQPASEAVPSGTVTETKPTTICCIP